MALDRDIKEWKNIVIFSFYGKFNGAVLVVEVIMKKVGVGLVFEKDKGIVKVPEIMNRFKL